MLVHSVTDGVTCHFLVTDRSNVSQEGARLAKRLRARARDAGGGIASPFAFARPSRFGRRSLRLSRVHTPHHDVSAFTLANVPRCFPSGGSKVGIGRNPIFFRGGGGGGEVEIPISEYPRKLRETKRTWLVIVFPRDEITCRIFVIAYNNYVGLCVFRHVSRTHTRTQERLVPT